MHMDLARRLWPTGFVRACDTPIRANYTESAARSLMKAISWRLCGTAGTSMLVYAFTSRFTLTLGVAALELVTKLGLYWVHERVWDRASFGRGRRLDRN